MYLSGLSTHLLARHKKALDDYFFNPQTGRLTPKDRSTLKIPKAVEVVANSFDDSTAMSKLATAAAERSIGQGGDGIWLLRQAQEDSDGESASDSDEKSPTDEFSPRMTNLVAENSPDFDGQDEVSQEDDKKKDRRKYNKGMSHRNSYRYDRFDVSWNSCVCNCSWFCCIFACMYLAKRLKRLLYLFEIKVNARMRFLWSLVFPKVT